MRTFLFATIINLVIALTAVAMNPEPQPFEAPFAVAKVTKTKAKQEAQKQEEIHAKENRQEEEIVPSQQILGNGLRRRLHRRPRRPHWLLNSHFRLLVPSKNSVQSMRV